MAKIKDYELPENLYYHKEHCWLKIESEDLVRVGLNDFAQKMAGDISYVDLPFEGDVVEKDDTCGKVQSSKWIGKFVAPISGEIVEVNQELESDATLINQDCYGSGWIIAIKPSNLEEDLKSLVTGEAAVSWLTAEIERVDKEIAEGKSYA